MQFLALNSRLESLVQLLTVLVVFIFVLAITYFGTRWVGNLQKEKMIGSEDELATMYKDVMGKRSYTGTISEYPHREIHPRIGE